MDRSDDVETKTRFRSERLFLSQHQWFCSTREGEVLGPFARHEQAVDALREYLLGLGIRPGGDVWDEPGISS